MISPFLYFYFYFYFISSIVSITFLLVLSRRSWGIFPKLYAHVLIWIQEKFASSTEIPIGQRLKIIQRRYNGRFIDRITADFAHKQKLNEKATFFDLENDLVQAGIEAIIQDDLLFTCEWAPTNHWNSSFQNFNKSAIVDFTLQWTTFIFGCTIRYFLLFPIRVCCLTLAMLFISTAAIFSFFYKYNQPQIVYIGHVFSRLFCQSIGLIAYYENDKYRPKSPGIAVANHISANDIQMLFSDPNIAGYTVTGQKHKGLIGWIESTCGRVGSTLWLERANANERRDFQKDIVDFARDKTKEPILLFPEGYCSNGAAVSLFRRSCFVENVDIYPIAVRQDPRLGDAFWKEDTFLPYMFRLMTSFAVIYHVRYLAPMKKKKSETAENFARRIQEKIAETNKTDALPFDMGVLKKKSEQKKLLDHSQFQCAKITTSLQ
uniref:Phospholipid/glycerol acyltransferase domain-containing protein n=1 Tax=Panagrolaimus sp. JU765 TaxID=591449 RepID=A0AC34QTF1_9BILA